MIRKPKDIIINKCFPIFSWKKCVNCGNEFKLEYGWRFIPKINNHEWKYSKYICKRCGKSKNVANRIAKHYNIIFNKVTPPDEE